MPFLIDIEGIDGSGKGTQAKRLYDRLVAEGAPARLLSFPRYDATLFGLAIGEFLNGAYGTLDQVHPFLVSLLFAGDRYESKDVLLEALQSSEVVVLDRYVPSNVAHQASKLDGQQRTDLARRILKIEFEIFALPKPDLVLLLDLPVALAQELIGRKAARNYTDRAHDLQEADGSYLGRVREMYLELARTEPNWQVIECCQAEHLKSVDDIAAEIWQQVASLRS